MKKIFGLIFLVILGLNFLIAQNSIIYPRSEANFEIGKELFDQEKYAASYRYFEECLRSNKLNKGDLQEAEYYLAISSYYMKSSEAYNRLTNYLNKHPYSPFINQVYFILGKLMAENGNYKKALEYFGELNEDRLNSDDRIEKIYLEAHALLQDKQYEAASAIFKQVYFLNLRYTVSAKYYYAYSRYMLNDFKTALPLFIELEKLDQYKRIVSYYIIQIYFYNKNYAAMTERAEDLLTNDPDNPNNAEIYRMLGEIEYEKREYERAIDFFLSYERETKQMYRNDIYFLGMSYYNQKDFAKAIEYLSRVTLKSDALAENAYLQIGNSYVNLKEIKNAKMAFESALDTSFDPAVRETALYNYALATYDSNAVFGESFSAFERFLEEFPHSKFADGAYSYLSSLYMTSLDYKKAYESLSKMRGLNRKLKETKQYILNQLGGESFVNNDYEKALEYFNLALEETPSQEYYVESLYWRAETSYRLGLYDRVIKDLETFFATQAFRRSPNERQATYLMGHAYFSLKKYREALRYFKQYTASIYSAVDISYAESFNRMGDCYYSFRDFENAELQYEKAIQLSPQTGDYSLFQLAYIKGLKKEHLRKIALLEKIISDFPNSLYADNAFYEIGRASLAMNEDDKAIAAYQNLLRLQPNSKIAPKAALEIGMVFLNKNDSERAITALKKVIADYPTTEEARTALESLEPIYIDQNKTAEYVEYVKLLGGAAQDEIRNKEDSILFVAGERLYFKKHYVEAIGAFTEYIDTYGTERSFSTLAKYYLANSYYKIDKKKLALKEYLDLTKMTGSKYREEAVLRVAEIYYDAKDYDEAETYFSQLHSIATTVENKNIARLGVLRTSYILGEQKKTIEIATEILDDVQAVESIKDEAYFNRAKAYISQERRTLAIEDLKQLENKTKTAAGAEAKYLLALQYYKIDDFREAENVVLDFARKNTPYQYWLARSFVLLADIYIERSDDFQAKQYLLSLQKNYSDKNDVQAMIESRLEAINAREQSKVIN